MKEWLALLLAALATGVALWGVPSWTDALADPCHLASLLAGLTVIALAVMRAAGPRAYTAERRLLAIFLVSMPLVYVASALVFHVDGAPLLVEIVAVPVFAALAVLGLARSPRWLAIGIAAHGVAWDAWHLGGSAIAPTWYARGCLLVDVALALYVLVRSRAWLSVPGAR